MKRQKMAQANHMHWGFARGRLRCTCLIAFTQRNSGENVTREYWVIALRERQEQEEAGGCKTPNISKNIPSPGRIPPVSFTERNVYVCAS